MSVKIVSFFTLVAVGIARSEPPSNSYGAPLAAPISSYGTPNYEANNDHHEYGEPKSYEFGYQVKDDYTGNNYNRREQSDGNQVRGEYRVQLPDGRTQIVTYYADWQTGFHADVKYEGEAQYPEQYNTYKGPSGQYGAPNYAGNNNYNTNSGYNYNNNNGFNNQNTGYSSSPASSSVSIKDYNSGGSGSGYNYNAPNNGFNNAHHGSTNLDNYSGNFGNKGRPSYEYGAP